VVADSLDILGNQKVADFIFRKQRKSSLGWRRLSPFRRRFFRGWRSFWWRRFQRALVIFAEKTDFALAGW
jgi:hypothetical protein